MWLPFVDLDQLATESYAVPGHDRDTLCSALVSYGEKDRRRIKEECGAAIIKQ
jgi:hypothetical protein